MAQPWQILDRVTTPQGDLELRRRGQRDFLITVGGLVLMNSAAHRSELALGALACPGLRRRVGARVLVGGLGMGFTLRSVLDSLPATGRVVVAELNPVVATWCRGPLADLTGGAVADPRVTVEIADVGVVIRRAAAGPEEGRFHAIVLDLYQGPDAASGRGDHPLYGPSAIAAARAALVSGGIFAVWGENHDAGFAKRLSSAGFTVVCERPGWGGLRHVVYVATKRPERPRREGPKAVASGSRRRTAGATPR